MLTVRLTEEERLLTKRSRSVGMGRYSWQGIHRVHAAKVARLQRRSSRRMGGNDAWQVAVAVNMGATVLGHDPEAFRRAGVAYEDHRRARR